MMVQANWVAADLLEKEPASLELLSIHEHVANFAAEGWPHLLIVGDDQVYPGPCSVALSTQDFGALRQHLKTNPRGLFADGRVSFPDTAPGFVVNFNHGVLDFSVPDGLSWDPVRLRPALEFVRASLKEYAQVSWCVSLLNDEPYSDNVFGREFAEHVPKLVRAITFGQASDFQRAIKALIGLGPGSTPSGDDLIHGVLLMYHYACKAQGVAVQPYDIPPEERQRTTFLGGHMLYLGIRGLTPKPVRDFLTRIFMGTVDTNTIRNLGRIGASTGWDIGIGASLTLSELLRTVA